ncbi:hypothetical protein GQ44DRAFT_832545 [Phaeosphaeriaceae sp. PMI808]|nr:hypothetical protein GQ44DRAFT_832545 [Phaeosphaeriaceae sp. PMI808]
MASEADSSLLSPALPSSASSTIHTSKTSRSPVAKHCREPEEGEPERDDSGRKLYYCLHCKKYKSNTTTNLRRHLLSAHGIKAEASTSHVKSNASETLHELWEKACLETDVSEFERKILRKHLNRNVIDTTLLNLIVTLNLSFRIVERTEFHLFCQALNLESRSFVPSAHSDVYAKLLDSFESEKDLVRKKLQSAISSLHISVDIWTTPNFYSCLAVCLSDQMTIEMAIEMGTRARAPLAKRAKSNRAALAQLRASL